MAKAGFDSALLARLEAAKLVQIETKRRSGEPRLTVIWIVVDDGEVFIRSDRGERGRWYQAAVRDSVAKLHFDGLTVPVKVVDASDADSIRRCSDALSNKYRSSRASLTSMLRDETLHTTLRLEPR